MAESIHLPLWLFAVLLVLASLSLLDRLLIPSVRWYFRRKVHKVLNTINNHLKIEIQPFKLTKRQSLIDRLVFDTKVLEAMQAWAQEQDAPQEEAMAKVRKYACEIVPSFNAYLYFRVAYWLAKKITQFIYRVRLGYTDEKAMAEVPPNASVVFIINHRSNMDYILVTYFAASHTALSYAVGEWARIWPLQSFIRSMGAYFVRRNSRNSLYRKVLERYVQIATAEGVTQAVFLEGGLSRDGKLRQPKLGLLDYLLRSYNPQSARDLVFIPVGLNYERTLEDRTLLLDQEAKPKKGNLAVARTTLGFLFHNLRLLLRGKWHRFGYACVNFGPPISTKAYLAEHNLDFHKLDKQERFAKVKKLAELLMKEVGSIVPVLPTSLVARILIERRDEWLDELTLKSAVFALMERFLDGGAHLYIPRRDMDYAIEVGLRMLTLRRLVEEKDGLFKAQPDEIPVLSYYANSVSHFSP